MQCAWTFSCLVNLPNKWSNFSSTAACRLCVQELPVTAAQLLLANLPGVQGLQLFEHISDVLLLALTQIVAILCSSKLC